MEVKPSASNNLRKRKSKGSKNDNLLVNENQNGEERKVWRETFIPNRTKRRINLGGKANKSAMMDVEFRQILEKDYRLKQEDCKEGGNNL